MFGKNLGVTISILVLFIIGAGGFYALYYKPNFEKQQVAGEIATGFPSNTNMAVTASNTPTPEPELLPVNITPYIFIDNNNDGTQGDNEEVCQYCVNKQLVCTQNQNLFNLTILSKGELQIQNANVNNKTQCWAVFDDRKAIIYPYFFEDRYQGDGSTIAIPLNSFSAMIIGNNLYLKEIIKIEQGYRYYFSTLIPALKEKSDKGQNIWVKLLPNASEPDQYYLQSSKVLKDSNGIYFFEVNWNLAKDLPAVYQFDSIEVLL